MEITITPRIEAMIQDRLDTGHYKNPDAVLELALRLLEQEERRERLRAALAEGDEGEPIPYTPELLASIRRSARKRFESGEIPTASDVFP